MGRWGDGEMGDGEMGRWGENFTLPPHHPTTLLPHTPNAQCPMLHAHLLNF
nr:hypothetical protein [Nostoc sp. CreGUA01]